MHFDQFGDVYVLRLDEGEELISELTEFCAVQGIELASITGVGFASSAKLNHYQRSTNHTSSRDIQGELHISSISGNVTKKGDEIFVVVHGTVTDGAEVAAGIISKATISGTCELFINSTEGHVGRYKDPKTGLELMEFG